jgi:hypothetical protein
MDAKTLISFNTEAVKLAAMGVTVVAASGDSGVSNFDCTCYMDSGSAASPGWTGTSWDGAGYFPVFPASSPWVRTYAHIRSVCTVHSVYSNMLINFTTYCTCFLLY